MTVMPRIPSRRSKQRRSSFVAPTSRSNVVPDALSWREQLNGDVAPKGPAAWSAARSDTSDRTVIDAGPYGVIDLAVMDAVADVGRNQSLGVVWWDKRSYREEDDDNGTIQTAFVPASISDHVSLAAPMARAESPTAGTAPRHSTSVPSAPKGAEPAPVPAAQAVAAVPPTAQVLEVRRSQAGNPAEPISASRPTDPDDGGRRGHVRRSRHVALVPKTRGRRARSVEVAHPRRAMLRRRRLRRRIVWGAVLVVVAFVTTVLVQSALVTPFTVPSVSMENTLHTGDRIAVNRLAYASNPIHRGDVVVFEDPGGWLNGSADGGGDDRYLVKRVIGVSGDRVTCCSADGKVAVNGTEIYEPYAVIPSGSPASSTPFDVTVPAGELWVLGDNRYNSRDSSKTRDLPSKGFVPIADVVGQATFKVWPLTQLSAIGTASDTFAAVPDQTCPI